MQMQRYCSKIKNIIIEVIAMEVLAKEVQNLVKDAKVLFVEDDESLV